MPERQRQVSSLPGEDQGLVILAATPQATAFPVVGNGQEETVVELLGQAENEIKMRDCGFHRLFCHGDNPFGNVKEGVVRNGEAGARGEAVQKFLGRWRAAESDITPDGD